MTENKWAQPIAIPKSMQVFPARVTGVYLPPIDEVPDEFQHGQTKWEKFVSTMFYMGWDGVNPTLVKREGVDAEAGFLQVRTVLGSFEPKHEHKEAGAAYLLSLFFEDIVDPKDVQRG